MGLGHNDPWVESHMWPQQMWGQRSSRGQWPLVQVSCTKGHCIHILWCIFMGLGHNDPWVESHIRPQQMWSQRWSRSQWPWFKLLQIKGHCIHILRCIFMGLGHDDPWVESHIWRQQPWGQRLFRGQWPFQARLVVREPPYWVGFHSFTLREYSLLCQIFFFLLLLYLKILMQEHRKTGLSSCALVFLQLAKVLCGTKLLL